MDLQGAAMWFRQAPEGLAVARAGGGDLRADQKLRRGRKRLLSKEKTGNQSETAHNYI
jgi:hypothetical protein